MSDFEWIALLLILGGVVGLSFVGIGVILGEFLGSYKRACKRELHGDSDCRIYVPARDRDRVSDNRRVKQVDYEGREVE